MTRTARFRDLHHTDDLLLMPNPWDVGSAKVLESLGFAALATTSSGAAAARGRLDGELSRDEALRAAADIAAAVEVPVSADLENGFADSPEGVADTFRRAVDAGLAGASIEDWDGSTFYEPAHAADRVRAAVDAAAGQLVITARAENHINGVDDFADTLRRIQAYAAAGADVVFAPGLTSADRIEALVQSVDVPVNVLAVPGIPSLPELRDLGVRRLSIGGSWAYLAYAALADTAQELRDEGTLGYLQHASDHRAVVTRALG